MKFIRTNRTLLLMMMMCLMLVIAAGCGNKPADGNSAGNGAAANNETGRAAVNNDNTGGSTGAKDGLPSATASHPVVTIEMDNGGIIKAELYPEVAPNTVNNFISLIQSGFYDGTIFHRVVPNMMIQGGDPEGTGKGGPGYTIAGEFNDNGAVNNLLHTPGVLSMARTRDADTAGSQFFIMVADYPSLDGLYAAFGKVTEGLDVAEAIANLEREGEDRPAQPPVMKKVTVDTLGVTYPEPQKVQ